MRYIRWSSELETGDHEVDEQHRVLHSMVNDLNASVLVGADSRHAVAALQRILRHTVTHFESEEALMARCEYPRIQEHVATHREFSEGVASLLRAQRAGEGPTVEELAYHMETWLETHIRGEDRLLVDHIRARKIGDS